MKNRFAVHLFQALSPLIIMILLGATNVEFFTMAIEGHVVLNAAILIAALTGTVLWLLRLFHAHNEEKALHRFAAEVKDGRSMKELVEEPWLARRSVLSYLENLAQTNGKLSSPLDQTAIDHELERLHDEFESKMELPGFLVGFMIALGLLGTFIGLLETLTGISSMLDGMVNGPGADSVESEFLKLVAQLRQPLAGMGVAFSASMFGLLGSLLLGVMQQTVKRYTKTVVNEAHELMNRLVERVRGPVGGMAAAAAGGGGVRGGVSEAFLTDFMADLTSNMNQLMELFHRSQDASLTMSTRVDNLARRLEDVAGAIETNVEAVKRTNDLLGFGPRMKETNEEMLSEIRSLLTGSQERQKSMVRLVDALNSIEQKLMAGNDGSRSHFELVGNLNVQSLAKLEEAVGVLHEVNDRTSDSETKLDRKMQNLTTATTAIGTTMQQLVVKLGELSSTGQTQLNNANSMQMMLRDASGEMQGLLKEVQEKLQKVQEVEIGATRHLYGIKEAVDGMGASLEPLKGLSQGVAKQTSLLEATLEEMRTSQRNLVRELRAELREASREAARQPA